MNFLRRMRPEKSTKSNKQDTAAAELPDEIITNILVRVLAKSLVRFKSVSKSWRCLINDPYFIRSHLNHVTSTVNEYESAILSRITMSPKLTTVFMSMGIYKKEEGTPIVLSVKDVEFPRQYLPYNAVIRACCDGMLCVTFNHKHVLIWNPSTRVYRKLPSPRQADTMYVYGIGYDCSVDDYKVVRASSRHKVQKYYSQTSVEVFALKSNTWKTVQDNFPYEIENGELPSFNNGCIHWVARRPDTTEMVIVSFDVVSEKLGEVPLPHSDDPNRTIALLLFGGSLRLVQTHRQGQVELWVMKEYRVRESWTELLDIPQWRELDAFYQPRIVPFCFTRNGIILLRERTNEFIRYNLSNDTFKSFTVHNFVDIYTIIPCVESLVSPICSHGRSRGEAKEAVALRRER